MDEQADDFGRVGFEGGLERGDGGVNVGHRQIVRQGAVAGDLDALDRRLQTSALPGRVSERARAMRASRFLPDSEMAGGRRVTKTSWMSRTPGIVAATWRKRRLDPAVAIERGGLLDGCGLTLDMGKDGGDFGHVAADVRLQLRDEVVRFAEWHVLVDFKVLLEVEDVAVLLQVDVMDGEV